jgi:hypothetical protein
MKLRYLFDEVDMNPNDSQLNEAEFRNFMVNVMHRDKNDSEIITSMTSDKNMVVIFKMADLDADKVVSFEETWNFW